MAIRFSIFLVAGIISILFRKQLNHVKKNIFEKINIKRKDERQSYIYMGIVFIVISVILFVIAMLW